MRVHTQAYVILKKKNPLKVLQAVLVHKRVDTQHFFFWKHKGATDEKPPSQDSFPIPVFGTIQIY